MATKRIDIMVTDDGNVHVKGWAQGYIMIKKIDNNKFLATTGSWKIIIEKDNTYINCSSKAIKKRNKFRIQTRSGSLFLYNSTNNWYWYFRQKSLQDILDLYKIDTLIPVEEESISLETCFLYKNGKYAESIVKKNPTLKYFGDNCKIDVNVDMIIDETICAATAQIQFDDFVLVEYLPNHRKLYTHNNIRIGDLYHNGRLNKINMKSILDDVKNEHYSN